jgi:hypothetical protein
MNGAAARAGWKAYAALVASGGRLDALAGFESGAWRRAGEEPVWLGRGSRPPHPRAVCLETAARPEGIDLGRLAACEPEPGPPLGLARDALAPCALLLAGRLPVLGEPKGLAALLAGRIPPFPLTAAVGPVHALAAAAGDDDPDAAFKPAHALLGLGPGLTPSGDDLVGALLFARRMLRDARAWDATATKLVEAARTRTHAISAALLADLAAGHGHAALHRVAAALAAGADPLPAARELTAIGAASGWEMLAGLLIGLAGPATLCARCESTP